MKRVLTKVVRCISPVVALVVLASVSLPGVASVQAQATESMGRPVQTVQTTAKPAGQSALLFGQSHSYSVIFRGNGEAITHAKLAFTNPDEEPLSEFSFELPKVSPSEIAIYQMKLPQNCVRYDYSDAKQPCLEYRDPDYGQQYYYGYGNGQAEYTKVQYKQAGDRYTLALPTPVEPYKSSAIIVAYAAKRFVHETLGLYKFKFETVRVASRVQQTRVAVDVDSDLVLKGKRAAVDYGEREVTADDKISAAPAISNPELDRIVSGIGASGALVKEAKNLAPNESFAVKGEYAGSWFRLYLHAMLLTVAIVAAIFVGLFFLIKWLKRRGGFGGRSGRGPDTGGNDTVQSTQQASPMGRGREWQNIVSLSVVLTGFISAVSVIGLTYLLRYLSETDLFRMLNADVVFNAVGSVAVLLVYALVVFGPAIVIAIRRGWKVLISILAVEFFWLVIFLLVYLAFFQSGLTPPTGVPPVEPGVF